MLVLRKMLGRNVIKKLSRPERLAESSVQCRLHSFPIIPGFQNDANLSKYQSTLSHPIFISLWTEWVVLDCQNLSR